MKRLLIVALLVAGCSSGSKSDPAPNNPQPIVTSPPAWTLDVTSFKGATTTLLGGSITATAVVKNTGSAASPIMKFQFNGLKDYADIVGCKPKCSTSDFLGAWYAEFAGLAAGKTATYEFEFIPTKIGAAHWSACLYGATGDDNPYCGDLTTTIR